MNLETLEPIDFPINIITYQLKKKTKTKQTKNKLFL